MAPSLAPSLGLGDLNESDPPVQPPCFDSIDNGGDGLTDYPVDPDCQSAADYSE